MGTVTCRAKVEIVELSNGKKEILVREIPYQVNKTRLIERIAELAKDKIIEGITDLRDESSRKGMKIVIEIRRDANANVILNNLYRFTQLQTTYSVNMIALDHGQPKCLNLKQILEAYVKHQIEVVTRRTEFDLEKAKNRLHIVEGLLIALADIDEVVATIKASKSTEEAVNQLITKFILTEIQAKAILDMKLQRLTGLEIEKLQQEAKELHELVEYLMSILSSHEKLMSIIVDELTEVQRKFGSERKTQIEDYVEVSFDKESYSYGDIVVITEPNYFNEPLIKRVIATGGQIVDIDYGSSTVYVDGVALEEPYINESFILQNSDDITFPYTVPEGHLFCMGDNRNHSTDSRSTLIGAVDERYILGRAMLRILPFGNSDIYDYE